MREGRVDFSFHCQALSDDGPITKGIQGRNSKQEPEGRRWFRAMDKCCLLVTAVGRLTPEIGIVSVPTELSFDEYLCLCLLFS